MTINGLQRYATSCIRYSSSLRFEYGPIIVTLGYNRISIFARRGWAGNFIGRTWKWYWISRHHQLGSEHRRQLHHHESIIHIISTMVFESTLVDLVTGIRSHKRDTALFISTSIADIKVELSSSDFYTKANALQKLTFLQMMGYSMSYATFGAVEVMSSSALDLNVWAYWGYVREWTHRIKGGWLLSNSVCGGSMIFWRHNSTINHDKFIHSWWWEWWY